MTCVLHDFNGYQAKLNVKQVFEGIAHMMLTDFDQI